MMEGTASVASDVLASYAADAALEVDGVRGLVERRMPRQPGVRIEEENGRATVELRVELEGGASAEAVGREVQRRVADYLERMAGACPAAVNVVVDSIGPP
jgi:uncharacterized alkaline shock family protein YloU